MSNASPTRPGVASPHRPIVALAAPRRTRLAGVLLRSLVLALTLLPVSLSHAVGQLVPFDEEPPPPFTLDDLDGTTHVLADYRGEVVLVNFWATWCRPCVREMPSMARLAARFADRPFALLAVNAGEARETLAPFLERLGIELTVLLDPDGTAVRDWGVFAYPTSVLLDTRGEAAWIVRGELDWEAPDVIAGIEQMMTSGAGDGPVLDTRTPAAESPARTGSEAGSTLTMESLPPLVAPGAREPDLALGPDGTVLASYLEVSAREGAALQVARLGTGGWSAPAAVARGTDWFVSWADFPALARIGDESLAVTWSVRNGLGPYGYDLNIARSSDGGRTWGAPIVPHRDGTPTQHGFASLAPLADGSLLVTWLDGRVNARASDTSDGRNLSTDGMTLRAALLPADGPAGEEQLLDERVCSCCAIASVALDDGGALLAYRDRTSGEIRDISVRRLRGDAWEPSRVVHEDRWRIAGCPINGPALAARDERVALAWFTAADEDPRVQIAFSDEGGDRFGVPLRVDDGHPLGRVDTLVLEDGSALVSWLERTAIGEELRVRRVDPDAPQEPALSVARSNRGRTMGFPRMVQSEAGRIVIAWTAPHPIGAIGSAVLTYPKP